jgi:hypothetical protein
VPKGTATPREHRVSASDFFSRWSRRKAGAEPEETLPSAAPAVAPTEPVLPTEIPEAGHDPECRPAPTLADVEKLTPDADFSSFVAPGVDEDVKRSALKKLFADPHFNTMDGLDTYIDDYSKPDPIPPAMLAALNHARGLLDAATSEAGEEHEKPAMPDKTEAAPPTDDPHDD